MKPIVFWIKIGITKGYSFITKTSFVFGNILYVFIRNFISRGARVAQWWEHSPPTYVTRVQTSASKPYAVWVCCWFSPLLREVFLPVIQFPPRFKNQYFQISIRSGRHGQVSTSSQELLSAPWINKSQKLHITIMGTYQRVLTKGKYEPASFHFSKRSN